MSNNFTAGLIAEPGSESSRAGGAADSKNFLRPQHEELDISPLSQDTTRHNTTRHDTTRHDTIRYDTTRYETTRDDTI